MRKLTIAIRTALTNQYRALVLGLLTTIFFMKETLKSKTIYLTLTMKQTL